MNITEKLDQVEYLLKHLPGRHDQQRHAPHVVNVATSLVGDLTSGDVEFLLGKEHGALEVGVYKLGDGSKEYVEGSGDVLDVYLDVPEDSVAGVHTHRPNTSSLKNGHPELSASDYRTALDRAMNIGSYETTAVFPDTGKYTTMRVNYDVSDMDHVELSSLFMELTAPMGGMVGIAKHAPEMLVRDGENIGLWEFKYGIIGE